MPKKDWKLDAKCLNLDTNFFFDKYEEDLDLRQAIDSLCQSCPYKGSALQVPLVGKSGESGEGFTLKRVRYQKSLTIIKTRTNGLMFGHP
jgi:hypothetical protein